MIEASLAHPRTPPTTRRERGLALFRERGGEIRHMAGTIWSVPSCEGTGVYLVDVEGGACTCPDTPPAEESCKHFTAADIARAKSGECQGCRRRFPRRELVEVREGGHDGMMFRDGDRLCRRCADGSGVAR